MKRTAIYPGTFDPITNGHVDIIRRSLRIFDELVVAVATNLEKKALFPAERRLELIMESVRGVKGMRVDKFDGLLVDYVNQKSGVAIIRGLRAVSDFEYEMQMALMNRRLDARIETIFMMPSEENTFLSSTMIKEIASFGGSVKSLVPEVVEKALVEVF
jgi:pantetheine-phosphate adenylyltransferase